MRTAAFMVIGACALGGCVERTVTITSDPPGALVWVNDREVGRTPLTFEFEYHGTYDVRLTADGYEPMLTTGKASAPLYDMVPLDLVAELVPARIENEQAWHYVLAPRNDDRASLLERAGELRAKLGTPGTQPE